MKIPRILAGASVIAAGLLVSGCVSSGYGPGPIYYGGYGGVYTQRYVYATPRVVPGPRYRYYRARPVYGPAPAYWRGPVYRSRPYYGPPGRYYRQDDRYER